MELTEDNIRSDSSRTNESTYAHQLIHEMHNAIENYAVIKEAYQSGRARDIADEPKVDGLPCLILGSGPSLDDSIQYLKGWTGGIICSTSHALTLMRYGIEPTHILALDPFSPYSEIEGIDWSKTKTKLITTPTVWPTLAANWPNDILLYISYNGHADSFYSDTMKKQYSRREGTRNQAVFHFMIRTEITLFACSPPMQMFCAQILGYGKIFLVGCDFGYSKTLSRFTGYTVKSVKMAYDSPDDEMVARGLEARGIDGPKPHEVIEWEEHVSPFIPDGKEIKCRNGTLTHEMHLFYKKNMMTAMRLSLQDVWVVGKGTIGELQMFPAKRLVRQWHKAQPISNAQKIIILEDYLASVGAYCLEFLDGRRSFVEAPERPVETLEGFMKAANRLFTCSTCGIIMEANNETDLSANECPKCKNKTVHRKQAIDIEANLARIRPLAQKYEPVSKVLTGGLEK